MEASSWLWAALGVYLLIGLALLLTTLLVLPVSHGVEDWELILRVLFWPVLLLWWVCK